MLGTVGRIGVIDEAVVYSYLVGSHAASLLGGNDLHQHQLKDTATPAARLNQAFQLRTVARRQQADGERGTADCIGHLMPESLAAEYARR